MPTVCKGNQQATLAGRVIGALSASIYSGARDFYSAPYNSILPGTSMISPIITRRWQIFERFPIFRGADWALNIHVQLSTSFGFNSSLQTATLVVC